MIRNYFKIAFRVFQKEKVITLTNILGMSLGITCSILIYLWVQDELSYNNFVEGGDRICYVMTNHPLTNGDIETYDTTPQPLKAVLEEKYPAIDKVALLSWGGRQSFKKENAFIQHSGSYASPEIFEIFQTPFIKGTYNLLYKQNNAIAISETFAKSYFGEAWKTSDIIGKHITRKNGETFEITGVFANIPEQSTLHFDFIIPYKKRLNKNEWLKQWGNFSNKMYVKLANNISLEEANESIKNAIIENRTDEITTEKLLLQPFNDQYLYNNFENGKVAGGRIEYVRLLSIAAILILLLASINFMNLSTARASKRAKETGVRKVLGALKFNLKGQFLVESILTTLFGFIVSIISILILLPQFNELTGKQIDIHFFNLEFVLYLILFIVVLGFLSGIYPAFYLSALNPVRSLKGVFSPSKREGIFRKSLIVFQFVITTVMIIGALSVYKQVDYIQNKNIGFDRENLVEIAMKNINPSVNYKAYRQELLDNPEIKGVTTISQNLLNIGHTTSDPEWDGKTEGELVAFNIMGTDPDFLSTTDIKLKLGRNFEWERTIDTANFIINEAACKAMRMENPIGQNLEFWDREGKVIGVIEDVHIHSLHTSMAPLILRYDLPMTNKMLVRIEANKTKQALASLKDLHDKFNMGIPFNYRFISDMYHGQYKSEYLIKDLVLYFTILAIFISCMGLLSLIAYAANQRAKEIGIRKVLGASITIILKLLSKDFLGLVLISLIVAIPIGYFVISGWLENFAYHIKLDWILFALSGFSAIVITFFIVSLQALKAAMINPIKSLRTE